MIQPDCPSDRPCSVSICGSVPHSATGTQSSLSLDGCERETRSSELAGGLPLIFAHGAHGHRCIISRLLARAQIHPLTSSSRFPISDALTPHHGLRWTSPGFLPGVRRDLPELPALLVIRRIVDTDTAYLSNIRALPTPEDSAGTYGTKGNLQYPPAILSTTSPATSPPTYFSDLQPKFHPCFNSVAAAALIGVSRPLLSILRGLDMDRPGKLHASIMTSDHLGSTPGIRVGTFDHLETFGNQGFPGFTNLKNFSLGEDTGRDLWLDSVLPQFDVPQLKTIPRMTKSWRLWRVPAYSGEEAW